MRKSFVIFRGLPGTGKTFLINKLKDYIPDLIVISRDIIRSKVFINPTYNNEEKDNILSIMLFLVEEHLKSKGSIVIDGMTFATEESMKPFLHAAIKHNAQIRIVECFCSEDTALKRIENDILQENHLAANKEEDLYYHVKEIFQPTKEFRLRINTDDDWEKNIEKIVIYLSAKILKFKDAD